MTTGTASAPSAPPPESLSREQPASRAVVRAAAIAAAGMRRFMFGSFVVGLSGARRLAEQEGHVDGDRAGGTAGRAGAAVPALVDVHEGLAVVRVDRQRV